MPQSFGVYGGQNQGVQPWAQPLTLFPGGQKVDTFFGLYASLGAGGLGSVVTKLFTDMGW